jgi:ABC-type Na+ transport system ATPase subunit NatA
MVNALYSGISKKGIQTPADFWKWIDSEKRREKITQRELDILEEIEDQREKNLPIEELRKLTVRILRRLYETLPSQIKAGMARRYLEEEYLEIQNIEKDLLKQMRSDVNFFQGLFSIFPTTFYLSTGNEISSRGYANIIRFYEEAIGTKKDFMTFYVGHRYGDNPDRIVNFIEEREKGEKEANIFKATCQLPGKFGLGMGFTLLWIFAALFFSYLSYKKALFPLPKEEITGLSDLELELEKGISNVVVSKGEAVCDHLYNVLSGKNKSFSGAVIRDKVHLETEKTKVDFVYLCQPEKIPGDIKVGHFIRFFRKTFRLSMAQLKEISTNKFKLNLEKMHGDTLGDLDEEAKGIILLEIARVRKRDVYMLYNYTRGMGSDCRREIIEQLKKLKQEEASILYITNDLLLAQEIGDYVSILKKEF